MEEAGNRHQAGVSLPPYLFLVVMTVLFRDVHTEINLAWGKWNNLSYTDFLYAEIANQFVSGNVE